MNYHDEKLSFIEQWKHFTIDMGPLTLTFYWEGRYTEVGHALEKWLGIKSASEISEAAKEKKKPHLKFVISASLYNDMLITSSSRESIRTWAWEATPVNSDSLEYIYICRPRTTYKKIIAKTMPQYIVRFANPLFNSYWELQTGYLLYHVILKVLYDILQNYNVTFAHAAGLSNPFGDAIIIAGAGGIGKTTTAAALVFSGHWKLIADDFVLVTEEGEIYDSRLPAHIYSYHSSIVKKIGISKIHSNQLDKIHWIIYSQIKKEGAVRRVSLPGKTRQGKLKTCFVVDVINGLKEPTVKSISHKVAANSIARYTRAELNLPESQSQLESSAAMLSQALAKTSCYSISINEKARGHGLASIIVEMVGGGIK
ncbi:hypothetical protein [Oceanithermus desulfurans]|uniref:HPr kinase/phosphorylase C-terminal domain-containing protein n=2 Tax=Oceanithermus desulfurans TaxID=227924 RepID=A0A511RNV7_9DEIN|nr:hypothetical protein [Oceanithermus desulfurans]MBB6030463.1 hypothetical protein [Oceanithermus desulfurans]GEM90767.1 hypothetical protein ODE01S_22010 [Oceanithermus desulfurans NBRC 100063]